VHAQNVQAATPSVISDNLCKAYTYFKAYGYERIDKLNDQLTNNDKVIDTDIMS